MRNSRVLLLLLVLRFVTVARAEADFIDFKTQSLGPAANGVLQIDDLTITGVTNRFPQTNLPVALVPGVGLGLGPLGKVNRCPDFSSSGLCVGPEGLIDLRLSGGGFTSVTIQPYIEAIGGPPPAANPIVDVSIGGGPLAGLATGGPFINAFAPFVFGALDKLGRTARSSDSARSLAPPCFSISMSTVLESPAPSIGAFR